MTTPDGPLITCTEVGRTYGHGPEAVVALWSATCGVLPADRIAIVGRSGSGKSTLLHLLAGLETPTTGEIAWPGLAGAVNDVTRIGLVFQAPTLIPSMTVLENVALPLLLHDARGAAGSGSNATERARDALAALGIDDLRDNLPQELSGGQAQRVVIARVLACRPKLILADEPTSQLDRATAEHVADVLHETSDLISAALVVATHDQSIAARLETVWPIEDGRLLTSTTAGGVR